MKQTQKNIRIIGVIIIIATVLVCLLVNIISVSVSPDDSFVVGDFKTKYWLQKVYENDSIIRIKFFDEMNSLAFDADYCKPKDDEEIIKRISNFNPITLELLYDNNSKSLIPDHIYGGYLQ